MSEENKVSTMRPVPFPVLRPERKGYPASPGLRARRDGLASAIAAGKYVTSPLPRESVLEGVRVLWFGAESEPAVAVIHFHGGAYRLGRPEMIGPFAAALSARCHVDVVCPDYRLAPEHPMPAALYDGANVIRAVLTQGRVNVILSGDSAGGGLAASLAALCIAAGIPLAGLVLISPWLDLTLKNACYRQNAATDSLFSFEAASEAAELYLQGVSAEDPIASPLFASLTGFPPTLISVGQGEVLRGDSEEFHSRLERAGARSRLVITAGMEHVAVTRDLDLPGAADTLFAVAEFIYTVLAGRSTLPMS